MTFRITSYLVILKVHIAFTKKEVSSHPSETVTWYGATSLRRLVWSGGPFLETLPKQTIRRLKAKFRETSESWDMFLHMPDRSEIYGRLDSEFQLTLIYISSMHA